jgi:hypothetical protein
MRIINIFNENGKTLQQIIEEFLIDYCLEIGSFNR